MSTINVSIAIFAARPHRLISNATTTAAILSFTNNPKRQRRKGFATKQKKVAQSKQLGVTARDWAIVNSLKSLKSYTVITLRSRLASRGAIAAPAPEFRLISRLFLHTESMD